MHLPSHPPRYYHCHLKLRSRLLLCAFSYQISTHDPSRPRPLCFLTTQRSGYSLPDEKPLPEFATSLSMAVANNAYLVRASSHILLRVSPNPQNSLLISPSKKCRNLGCKFRNTILNCFVRDGGRSNRAIIQRSPLNNSRPSLPEPVFDYVIHRINPRDLTYVRTVP